MAPPPAFDGDRVTLSLAADMLTLPLSILEEGAGSEEAEVLDNLADVLGGLGLEDEDTQESLKGQIWSKWRQVRPFSCSLTFPTNARRQRARFSTIRTRTTVLRMDLP